MAKKAMYLIRDPDGKMRTVIAQSSRGALKKLTADNPRLPSGHYDVKLRGAGLFRGDGWQRYRVS